MHQFCTKLNPPLRAALAALLLLAAGLALALALHNGSAYRTGQWDATSQDLVFGRVLQMELGQHTPGGFLGSYTEDWSESQNRYLFRDGASPDAAAYRSYTHQSGLQGTLWGLADRLLLPFFPDGAARETALYTLNSALFYAAVLAVCLAAARAMGAAPAAACFLAVLLSPWLQRCMKDLYWCLWTWLLPLLAVLAVQRLRSRGRYLLVTAAVLLRCMCGFEFISTLLILCELPLVWQFVRACPDPVLRRERFGQMAAAGVAAVGGVAAALAVWAVQGRLYFGSWAQSFANVGSIITARVSVTDEVSTVAEVLGYYLFQDTTPLLRLGPAELPLQVFLPATAAAAGAAALLLHRDRAALAKLNAAAVVWAVSFLGPVSWMVLSKTHSHVHTHLVPMLWNFAFVPCGCMLWAVAAQQLIRKGRGRAADVAPDQAL